MRAEGFKVSNPFECHVGHKLYDITWSPQPRSSFPADTQHAGARFLRHFSGRPVEGAAVIDDVDQDAISDCVSLQ